MLKTNKIVTLLIGGLFGLIMAIPVKAGSAILSIQTLPSYINKDNFKISCTSNGEYAQFYVNKNGGGEVAFGSSIDLSTTPCQVEVTGSQVNEETTYVFTVKLNTGETSSTTTIFDKSGPDTVSGFYKEGLSDGFKLHYHTPSNDDFSRVIIYRGNAQGFEADSSHEIATVTSSRDSDMTYEDHIGSTENRYYLIRAIDKAGNSSGLAGDGGASSVTVSATTLSAAGEVKILPVLGQGSVLGTEATNTPTPELTPSENGVVEKINAFANETSEPFKWILTHKKIVIGLLIIIALLIWHFRQYNKAK